VNFLSFRYIKVSKILLLLLAACATSPTGRKQMLLLPESKLAQMGEQSFDELKRKTPQSRDQKTINYVNCVMNPILDLVGRVDGVRSWEIVVFQDAQANAFALPGGKIGVYTGLLSVAETPDQLAAVMGHEVGHVISKHGNERVSEAFALQSGMELLNLALSNKSGKDYGLLMAAIGVGAQFGVVLPHSRAHESEADIIGLDLMARAGFRPEASVDLWRNMGKASGGRQPPEFASTHPANETRIKQLQANMHVAQKKFDERMQKGGLPYCVR
jgi:predicted Zn-dependent protease